MKSPLLDGFIIKDNDKLIKNNKDLIVLAKEKGFNTYTKTIESDCNLAEQWWDKNNKKWQKIKLIWEKNLSEKNIINLEKVLMELNCIR